MTVTKNDGTYMSKDFYQYKVELGVRGQSSHHVAYINSDYGQCSCGRLDCEHLQAWANHMEKIYASTRLVSAGFGGVQ